MASIMFWQQSLNFCFRSIDSVLIVHASLLIILLEKFWSLYCTLVSALFLSFFFCQGIKKIGRSNPDCNAWFLLEKFWLMPLQQVNWAIIPACMRIFVFTAVCTDFVQTFFCLHTLLNKVQFWWHEKKEHAFFSLQWESSRATIVHFERHVMSHIISLWTGSFLVFFSGSSNDLTVSVIYHLGVISELLDVLFFFLF